MQLLGLVFSSLLIDFDNVLFISPRSKPQLAGESRKVSGNFEWGIGEGNETKAGKGGGEE